MSGDGRYAHMTSYERALARAFAERRVAYACADVALWERVDDISSAHGKGSTWRGYMAAIEEHREEHRSALAALAAFGDALAKLGDES